MAQETEGLALDDARTLAGVRAVLADEKRGFYLVAEREGAVVGQLMITTEWSDWRNAWFWWIQSVYVLPAHRRTGVFRALHDEVLRQVAARDDVCGVRLYVEKDNTRAQQTYQDLGMAQTDYLLFEQRVLDQG